MTKHKKKRNKVYTGVDASITRPIITRLEATDRNKLAQWWFDHKRVMKPTLITTAVAIVIIWLLIELIRVVSGA